MHPKTPGAVKQGLCCSKPRENDENDTNGECRASKGMVCPKHGFCSLMGKSAWKLGRKTLQENPRPNPPHFMQEGPWVSYGCSPLPGKERLKASFPCCPSWLPSITGIQIRAGFTTLSESSSRKGQNKYFGWPPPKVKTFMSCYRTPGPWN